MLRLAVRVGLHGGVLFDPQLAMSTANQFPVRACLNFTTNWYIFGAQYAVIIFAALHGYLQRRHNVKMQEKAKKARRPVRFHAPAIGQNLGEKFGVAISERS